MEDIYKKVLYYFEEISKIPRNSKREDLISDYIVEFAQKYNLDYVQDENKNVLIRKSAKISKADTIILQGHLDMVCIKEEDSNHNFETDGIQLIYEGHEITANKTTLGADNGIAVAYMLVILESDINHPNLECLFTTDEEEGMSGIKNFNFDLLKGKYFINLDNETEQEVIIGSAGGVRVKFYQENNKNIDNILPAYKIEITGLAGGHSGVEIDKGLQNSNLLMAELLNKIQEKNQVFISKFIGGKKANAISNQTKCIIHSDIKDIKKEIEEFQKTIITIEDDKNLNIQVTPIENRKSYDIEYSKHIIKFLINCKQNVITRFSTNEPCTSANIGVVNITSGKNEIEALIRSGDKNDLNKILKENEKIAIKNYYQFQYSDPYPIWTATKQSKLLEKYSNVYKKCLKKELSVKNIHAGLECCIAKEKKKNMEIISIGPNIYNVHSTKERLEINSAKNVFNVLTKLLEEW